MILKLLSMTFLFFQNLWRTWIQPYIDYIIITLLLGYLEKIPVFGRFLRRCRIVIRWYWRKIRLGRTKIIDRHIDHNVHLLGERIHQHVNKKKETLNPPEDALSREEALAEINRASNEKEKQAEAPSTPLKDSGD